MIQGGDPTGTGKGGESIWGGKFDDQFHPECRVRSRELPSLSLTPHSTTVEASSRWPIMDPTATNSSSSSPTPNSPISTTFIASWASTSNDAPDASHSAQSHRRDGGFGHHGEIPRRLQASTPQRHIAGPCHDPRQPAGGRPTLRRVA
jgi:hypothetical protein